MLLRKVASETAIGGRRFFDRKMRCLGNGDAGLRDRIGNVRSMTRLRIECSRRLDSGRLPVVLARFFWERLWCYGWFMMALGEKGESLNACATS